jgi:hypothetical protein
MKLGRVDDQAYKPWERLSGICFGGVKVLHLILRAGQTAEAQYVVSQKKCANLQAAG